MKGGFLVSSDGAEEDKPACVTMLVTTLLKCHGIEVTTVNERVVA
jgi:hypothetical protein